MKTIKRNIFSIFALAILVVLAVGCKKENNTPTPVVTDPRDAFVGNYTYSMDVNLAITDGDVALISENENVDEGSLGIQKSGDGDAVKFTGDFEGNATAVVKDSKLVVTFTEDVLTQEFPFTTPDGNIETLMIVLTISDGEGQLVANNLNVEFPVVGAIVDDEDGLAVLGTFEMKLTKK